MLASWPLNVPNPCYYPLDFAIFELGFQAAHYITLAPNSVKRCLVLRLEHACVHCSVLI
jgi:hypothetical protein